MPATELAKNNGAVEDVASIVAAAAEVTSKPLPKTCPPRMERLYSDHAAKAMRMEQIKVRVQTAECPFSPQITRKAKRFASMQGTKRCDMLYQAAETYESNKVARRAALDPECSFSPKISTKARKLQGKGFSDRGARFERMYEAAGRSRKELARKRLILGSEYTFCPHTNSRSGGRGGGVGGRGDCVAAQGDASSSSIATVSYLSPSKDTMQRRAAFVEARRRKLELEGCTFHPVRVTLSSKEGRQQEILSQDYVPIYERQTLEIARRDNKLKALRKKIDQERLQECTFSPEVHIFSLTSSATGKQDLSSNSSSLATMTNRPKITINVNQAIDVSTRLYVDAQRKEAKRSLLAQSWHLVEMNQGQCLKKIEQHLTGWDLGTYNVKQLSPRLAFLHSTGTNTVARKLSEAKDPCRRHSLEVAQENEEFKETTLSPKINKFSQDLHASMLLGSSEAYCEAYCDNNPFVSSPRYIRLYDTDKKWRTRATEAHEAVNEEIDRQANTAFSAACSPTFQKQRKHFCDSASTAQLYFDHARIQQRKERLYHELNRLAREKQNIWFIAQNIPRLDVELRNSLFDNAWGAVSPELQISPRSRRMQEHNLGVLHDRHERILAAQQGAMDMHEKCKDDMATTVFSAHSIKKTDRKLHTPGNIKRIGDKLLHSMSSFSFIKSKKLFAKCQPKHDKERLIDPNTNLPVVITMPGTVAPASPLPLNTEIKAVSAPSSSFTMHTTSSALRLRGKAKPKRRNPQEFKSYAWSSNLSSIVPKSTSRNARPMHFAETRSNSNNKAVDRCDSPSEKFITSDAKTVVLAAQTIKDVLNSPEAASSSNSQSAIQEKISSVTTVVREEIIAPSVEFVDGPVKPEQKAATKTAEQEAVLLNSTHAQTQTIQAEQAQLKASLENEANKSLNSKPPPKNHDVKTVQKNKPFPAALSNEANKSLNSKPPPKNHDVKTVQKNKPFPAALSNEYKTRTTICPR